MNYYAPDGYRYGVMHHDGSVSNRWNGRTQRARVEEAAARWRTESAPDNIRPVRRAPGDSGWSEYRGRATLAEILPPPDEATARRVVAAFAQSRTSITCPACGRTSWNPNDVREGYCGNCHDWTTPRT